MRQQTMKFNQLASDVKRYKELKAKLNPSNLPFIVLEDTDDCKEFNSLTIKLTPLLTQTKL